MICLFLVRGQCVEAGVPREHPQFFWQFVNNCRSTTPGFERVILLVVPASTHQSPFDGAAFPAALFCLQVGANSLRHHRKPCGSSLWRRSHAQLKGWWATDPETAHGQRTKPPSAIDQRGRVSNSERGTKGDPKEGLISGNGIARGFLAAGL